MLVSTVLSRPLFPVPCFSLQTCRVRRKVRWNLCDHSVDCHVDTWWSCSPESRHDRSKRLIAFVSSARTVKPSVSFKRENLLWDAFSSWKSWMRSCKGFSRLIDSLTWFLGASKIFVLTSERLRKMVLVREFGGIKISRVADGWLFPWIEHQSAWVSIYRTSKVSRRQ